MILIGENINIMSKTLGPAIRERDAKAIQEVAKKEAEAGMDYIDLNIGPARKEGEKTMEWIVKTVHEVVDLPLSLDTTNHLAIEAGLQAHKKGGKPIVNSVSLQKERIENTLPLVPKYGAIMIGLLWGREGMPRDTDERAANCAELVMIAQDAGVPLEDIWIDPIVTPVSVDINQVVSCLEFMSVLEEVAPGCRSVVGLSNVSNGTPRELRPYLNRTYLAMLMKYGLHAAIVDAFDEELVMLARGKMPEILDLVHRVMDGEEPDLSKLSEKEVQYVKTTKVLMGKVLYSHSWLEV
jgi:cobalamin-dependent methionine synthase I